MSKHVNIKRGLDIKLDGVAEKVTSESSANVFALKLLLITLFAFPCKLMLKPLESEVIACPSTTLTEPEAGLSRFVDESPNNNFLIALSAKNQIISASSMNNTPQLAIEEIVSKTIYN